MNKLLPKRASVGTRIYFIGKFLQVFICKCFIFVHLNGFESRFQFGFSIFDILHEPSRLRISGTKVVWYPNFLDAQWSWGDDWTKLVKPAIVYKNDWWHNFNVIVSVSLSTCPSVHDYFTSITVMMLDWITTFVSWEHIFTGYVSKTTPANIHLSMIIRSIIG